MAKIRNTGALFSAFDLRGLTLRNRVVMSPLTRSRAGDQRLPNSLMAEYYAQRASAGLIISEATVISQQGIGWLNSPGIYSDEQAQAWKRVVDVVHAKGTPMFLQLWHCGRASHSSFHPDQGLPVAPSAIMINEDHIYTPIGKQPYETPRALETEEVPAIVEDYRRAAERAKTAGFDGVEIHSANGYLLDQFLQSKTNQRKDRYGGSLENRFRFLDETVRAILTVWPSGRLGVHVSPNGNFNDMGSPDFRETFLYIAKQLDRYELAYLHVVDGLEFGFHGLGTPMTLSEFRDVFRGPLMGNCGYTQDKAEAAIQSHNADLISFGRPFISNPDLVERFANEWPLNPPADTSVWYSFDEVGYADFPRYSAINELHDRTIAGIGALYEFYELTLWTYLVVDKVQQDSPSTILFFPSDVGLEDSSVEDYRERLPSCSQELMKLVFIQLLSKFEAFFFDLLKILLIERPVRLPKASTIAYGDIIECDDLNELLDKLVAKELDKLKYRPVREWFERLQEMVSIRPPSDQQIDSFVEMKASRDLIIHNSGIINEIYIKKVGASARGALGDSITLPEDYLRQSFKLVTAIARDVCESTNAKL